MNDPTPAPSPALASSPSPRPRDLTPAETISKQICLTIQLIAFLVFVYWNLRP